MTLYLLKFNNYYNRLVKAFDDLNDYKPYVVYTVEATNFNPADGVNTSHVVGVGNVSAYDGAGDYLIAVEKTGTIDTIVSRWFIIESIRTRAGQYQLTLHRDLVVDYYNVIKQSPMFVEKATLPDSDNFIFNNEDMTFNQIKTSQTPLFDETGCPWVVGYIPRDSFTTATKVEAPIFLDSGIADLTVASLDTWEYNKYQTEDFRATPLKTNYNVYVSDTQQWKIVNTSGSFENMEIPGTLKFTFNQEGYAGDPDWPDAILLKWAPNYEGVGWSFASVDQYPGEQAGTEGLSVTDMPDLSTINRYYNNDFLPSYRSAITRINTAARHYINFNSPGAVAKFKAIDGKILLATDQQLYYKISVVPTGTSQIITQVSVDNNEASLYSILNSNLVRDGVNSISITGTPDVKSFSVEIEVPCYRLELRTIDARAVVTLNSNRLHLDDSPYDMFCMPYSDIFKYHVGEQEFTASKTLARSIATEIGADTGTGNIYDIQILPYCPVRYCIRSGNRFDSEDAPVHIIYSSDNEEIKQAIGAIFWANTSTFSFTLNQSFTANNLKISSQTDLWRLCSPNGSGMFDFNVAKNGGTVEYFNVDCTYKPFNPYIHVAPDFARLYGQDFNDYRGLTCGGDFSLAQLSNAWSNYELNNKNYQAMFDRNVQSMELKNSVQKKMDIANAIAGTVSGAASGAMAGMAAGGVGALVGGVIGAAGAGITGAMDVKYNDMLRNDALDLTKDQFGYQLGNIQAIPTSITKTSALTANNPLVPYVEYYTCSDAEKQALINKIKYNGMTVMRIGTIQEFLQNEPSYIKGRLIRIEYVDNTGNVQNSIDDDYHLINSIANELNQGVYI